MHGAQMSKILVVDDDKKLSEAICDCLQMEKHTVEAAYDGGTARDLLQSSEYDLVVLDVMLPGASGFEICEELRNKNKFTAILMLTGRDSIPDKQVGFEAGADDYLTKPFNVKELLSRVKALLRRATRPVTNNQIKIGNVVADIEHHRIFRDGEEIHLAPKEFALLEFLMRNKGSIFSGEALLARVWPADNETSPEMIRAYVRRLRKKLDVEGSASIIRTAHRLGYSVDEPQ
jgi:DNA-binding response OmpR family regulator